MGEPMYVYTVFVGKIGENEPFDKLTFVAMSNIHCSHLAEQYVQGNEDEDIEPKYNFEVEIFGITRVAGLGKVENLNMNLDNEEEHYDLNEPLDLSGVPGDNQASFKCSCLSNVKVAVYDWPATRCPNCQRIILRKDLTEIGGTGIWAYTPSNGDGK